MSTPTDGGARSHTGTGIREDAPRGLKYLSFNKQGQQEIYAPTPFFVVLKNQIPPKIFAISLFRFISVYKRLRLFSLILFLEDVGSVKTAY